MSSVFAELCVWCAALAEHRQTGRNPSWVDAKAGGMPKLGEVDVLHASPPCQELSPLNQHTDFFKAEKTLFPLLDQVPILFISRCMHLTSLSVMTDVSI